jgi:hypothetical protein
MMAYPVELSKGDKDQKTSELVAFFKKHNWEHSWDFDKHTREYWYDVSYKGRGIMQVEFDVPVATMIEEIKKFAPETKDALPEKVLELLAKKVPEGKSFYITK